MTDLVTRLREAADPTSPYVDTPWWWDSPDKGGPAPLLREAAAELERLRVTRAALAPLAAVARHGYSGGSAGDALRHIERQLLALMGDA